MATKVQFSLSDATGSYSWITEGCDVNDYQHMTDEEIAKWVDELINQQQEMFDADLREAEDEYSASGSFPRYGYTTAQRFESVEEWVAFKGAEAQQAVADEREAAVKYVKNWIAAGNS